MTHDTSDATRLIYANLLLIEAAHDALNTLKNAWDFAERRAESIRLLEEALQAAKRE